MAVTSITGTGIGAAVNQKGSEHMRLGAEKLIGPRVVAADDATLNGSGVATIKLPALSGSAAEYCVMANDSDTTAAGAVAAALTMDATSTTVALKGPNSSVVCYVIVKKGLAI